MLKKILVVMLILILTLSLVSASYSPGFAFGKVIEEQTLVPIPGAYLRAYFDTREGPKVFKLYTDNRGSYKIPIIIGGMWDPVIQIRALGYHTRTFRRNGLIEAGFLLDFSMKKIIPDIKRGIANTSWQIQPYTQG